MSIRNYFVPTQSNNYHPYLIRKTAIVIFAVTLFVFNTTLGKLPSSKVSAAIVTSSIVQLHNQERAKAGLGPLSVNSTLINSANSKAKAMLDSNCWSHYCPNGKSPWAFFQEAGYSYIYAGENLAEGFTDNETVMNAWLNSPTHKANILKPEFREIGIGIAQGSYQGNPNNTIIVVHFGTQVQSNFNLPSTKNAPAAAALPNDVIPPKAPLITSPLDGTITNNNLFEISGKVNEDSTIQLFDNNVPRGQIISKGGIFDYKPTAPFTEGDHLLYVTAQDASGNKSDNSNEVSVKVDTIAPEILMSLIEVLSAGTGDRLRIRVQIHDDIESASMLANKTFIDFEHVPNSSYWEADITQSIFIGTGSIEITATDKAGNSTTEEIGTSHILGSIDKVNLQTSSGIGNTDLKTLILSRELPSIKNIVSLIFTLFLLGLFVLDAYMLAKTHIDNRVTERTKSHFHISGLIVIVLVILIGGIGGNILTGISQ